MSQSKSTDLLNQLSELETMFNSFSFDELPVDEATELKEMFNSFKQRLEDKIWGVPTTSQKTISQDLKREIEIIDSSIRPDAIVETINLNLIFEDCLGEIEVVEDLVILYKQNILEFIGKVKLALENKDFEVIRLASHKVICGLKMIETKRLLEIVDSMSNVSKTTQDIAYLRFLFECFVNEYPIIEASVDEQLAVLQNKNNS